MVLTTCRVNIGELNPFSYNNIRFSYCFSSIYYTNKGQKMIIKPEYKGERLLTLKETAELLSLNPDTLYRWRMYNKFPELQRIKIGGRVFFKLSCITSLMN